MCTFEAFQRLAAAAGGDRENDLGVQWAQRLAEARGLGATPATSYPDPDASAPQVAAALAPAAPAAAAPAPRRRLAPASAGRAAMPVAAAAPMPVRLGADGGQNYRLGEDPQRPVLGSVGGEPVQVNQWLVEPMELPAAAQAPARPPVRGLADAAAGLVERVSPYLTRETLGLPPEVLMPSPAPLPRNTPMNTQQMLRMQQQPQMRGFPGEDGTEYLPEPAPQVGPGFVERLSPLLTRENLGLPPEVLMPSPAPLPRNTPMNTQQMLRMQQQPQPDPTATVGPGLVERLAPYLQAIPVPTRQAGRPLNTQQLLRMRQQLQGSEYPLNY